MRSCSTAATREFKAREAESREVRGQALKLVREATGDAAYSDVNYVFPTFITTHMPIGVVGLLIAAIFAAAMSTISAELVGAVDGHGHRFLPAVRAADRGGQSLPEGVAVGDRVLGPVRHGRGGLGGGARIAHRGREPLRVVLLWVDSRRVHSGDWIPARHADRRLRRDDCRHDLRRARRAGSRTSPFSGTT